MTKKRMDSRFRGNDKEKEKKKRHSYPIDGRNSVVSCILTNKYTGLRLGRQNVNPHFF